MMEANRNEGRGREEKRNEKGMGGSSAKNVGLMQVRAGVMQGQGTNVPIWLSNSFQSEGSPGVTMLKASQASL